MVVESFRPGVVDRLGVGYEAVRAVNPAVVYCSTSGYGQSGPRSGWAGHDLDYLAVGGYLASSGPRADGGPPIPGATVADAAAGGMQAALAVTAALFAAPGDRPGRPPRRVGGRRRAVADVARRRRAPGHRVRAGTRSRRPLRPLRLLRHLPHRRRGLAGRGRHRAPSFFANLCRALGLERWVDHQLDDDAQAQIRADFAAAFAANGRDHWVARLSAADTCVAPVLTVAEVADDPGLAGRGSVVEARHPERGAFRQLAPLLAGMVRSPGPVDLPDPSSTDTESLLAAAGVDAKAIGAWRDGGAIA